MPTKSHAQKRKEKLKKRAEKEAVNHPPGTKLRTALAAET